MIFLCRASGPAHASPVAAKPRILTMNQLVGGPKIFFDLRLRSLRKR